MKQDKPLANKRIEEGKARRKTVPRAAHSELGVAKNGRDIVAILETSNRDRLEQLVPVRHSRMLESPFAFYRGSAAVHAADLSATPNSGIIVQACGDCHLMNFGGFATPERDLVFDINDFDETFPAPWEWDIKRLTASLVLAARWKGYAASEAADAVAAATLHYRQMMHEYADMPTMDVWYSRITYRSLLDRAAGNAKVTKMIAADTRRARSRTAEHVFQKIATKSGDTPRIVDQPPLIYHPQAADLHGSAQALLAKYAGTLREDHRALLARFRYLDVAIKVVGVGSVGTRCFIVLLQGEHDDPLFLQIKEARQSVLQPFVGRSRWSNEGERVVAGQRLMQAVSDIFLGWARGARGRDVYVRQLRDMKISLELEKIQAEHLALYGGLCGAALARAHAKAGQAQEIAGYLGAGSSFDEALGQYARAYADQVERDYETFRDATRTGRLKTQTSTTPVDVMIS
jgi:uncharacterized protein (DUF2252 family)